MTIPRCPRTLPQNILKEIEAIGKLWKQSDINPKFSINVLDEWSKLITNWKDDDKMPLIIRKSGEIRGQEIIHNNGRAIIISDNSPAQWVCYNVLSGITYNKEQIIDLLKNDKIPISFAIKAKEKDKIKYKCILGKYSINKFGWKLCHIEDVGLKSSRQINEIDIVTLEKKFFLLMNPKNFFLVPKAIGGIGEIKEFKNQQI